VHVPSDAPLAWYVANNPDFLTALRCATYKKDCLITTNGDGELAELVLTDTRVTADEFRQICGFGELRYLCIIRGAVDDSALIHVKTLPKLEVLGLCANPITDEGVRHLAVVSNLEEVHLGGTQISDDALASLRELPKIRRLSLNGTRITDASIRYFKEIVTLKELWIYDTQITPEGVDSLREALGDCHVCRCQSFVSVIPPQDITNSAITETTVRIHMYMTANGSYPKDLSVLPFRDGYSNRTKDGWGQILDYEVDDEGIISLKSLGRDGKPGVKERILT
jgi:hypothetical protein